MPLIEVIQRIIYLLEIGAGSRLVRVAVVVLLFALRCLWLDVRDYKNLSTQEAMDAAQLARNVTEGRGYTTDFIRPFSIYLVQNWNQSKNAGQPASASTDFARLQSGHPDLANPPAYPLFLAAWMRVLPFSHTMEFKKPFWSEAGHFGRDKSDVIIATLNQLLLALVIWQIFGIARKLFDAEVAWVTAFLTFGSELLWDFTYSGLPTLLEMVVFLELTRRLIAFEEAAREPAPAGRRLMMLAVTAGLLAGLGALTRYGFGTVILPVMVWLLLTGGTRRWTYTFAAAGAFFLLLAPWVVRNYLVCGMPFGTAGFAMLEGTLFFPGLQLQQSLHPDLSLAWQIKPYLHKFWTNLGDLLQHDWPLLGGSWLTMLFFAGLLIGFRGIAVRRLRYFLLMCLALFTVVQALAQTELTKQSPVFNSENLLVLLLPLILIYGVVFFFTCLEQFDLPVTESQVQLRYVAIAVFIFVMCLPAVGRRFGEKVNPLAYPPYYPPEIQTVSGWMNEKELMMSDVPWAVAWYGHRQCVWLTLNTGEDFYALNDFVKPVQALYLTAETLDFKLLSDCLRTPADSWGNFVLKKTTTGEHNFPLQSTPESGVIKSGLFLTDRPRWLDTAP